jgi:preprotein translocase subunit SecF
MNIMKFRHHYLLFSLSLVVVGLAALTFFKLKPAIDFTGGSVLELQFATNTPPEQLSTSALQADLKDLYHLETVQPVKNTQVILRGAPLSNDQKNKVVAALAAKLGKVSELRFETVGPVLGRELLIKTFAAIVIVSLGITFYIGKQFFNLKFGVAATVAMLHDAIIILGSFALLGHFAGVQVDVLFVTALLTTLSFSVHDTVIVFDRIREMRKRNPRSDFVAVVNAAVLETVNRSFKNSFTVILMLLSLVLLGGESLRWFGVALLIGALTGTYSSTFVAAPLLLVWDEVREKIRSRSR